MLYGGEYNSVEIQTLRSGFSSPCRRCAALKLCRICRQQANGTQEQGGDYSEYQDELILQHSGNYASS